MYEEPLSSTPLPPIRAFSSDEMAELEVLAKRIDRGGKTMPPQERKLTESEINARVCQLYGLTQEQVAVLNVWSSSWSNDPLRTDI